MSETIKLTNRDVLESVAALNVLASLKLPAKAAYAAAKALNKLVELEKTIRPIQRKLWEKYGEKDESGNLKYRPDNSLQIPQSNAADFIKEHSELMEETNDVQGLRPISIGDLKDAEIEASVIIHLEWFIKDE